MSDSSVLAIIFNKTKDKVLLIHRRDTPVWVLPGGGIDPGETPEEAVIREVLEETGLRGVIIRKIALYTPINRLAQVTHFFEIQAENINFIDRGRGPETKEVNFFPINQPPSNFFHIHHEMMQDALLNERFIERELKSVTYWNVLKYFF